MKTPRLSSSRPALTDDALRELCELATIKGQVSDQAQLCRHIEQAIADSWFLYTMTKVVPWKPMMKLFAETEANSVVLRAAEDRLQAALNNGASDAVVIAEEFAEAKRKQESSRAEFVRLHVSFLETIEPAERERVIIAIFSALVDGFGKANFEREARARAHQFALREAAGDLKDMAPPAWVPRTLAEPLMSEMNRAMERIQQEALRPHEEECLSARIGAIVFDAQIESRLDGVLDAHGLSVVHQSQRPRGRGRPKGSKRHLECRFFVDDLIAVVVEAGGDLTIDKNYGAGTLPVALRLLKPYLPPPMTDEEFSFSLLAEIRTAWRASTGQKIHRASAE